MLQKGRSRNRESGIRRAVLEVERSVKEEQYFRNKIETIGLCCQGFSEFGSNQFNS